MPLPRKEIYNPLNGEEIKHLLTQRVVKLLDSVPYLQRHIVLDRVKMSIKFDLAVWNGSVPVASAVDSHVIEDDYEIVDDARDYAGEQPDQWTRLEDTINASPTPGGIVPDQIREEAQLPVMTATRIVDPTGKKICVSDVPMLDGQVVEALPGLVIDRTGLHPAQRGATLVQQDFGVAGLGGNAPRDPRRDSQSGLSFGNKTGRDGPVRSPRVHVDKE